MAKATKKLSDQPQRFVRRGFSKPPFRRIFLFSWEEFRALGAIETKAQVDKNTCSTCRVGSNTGSAMLWPID